MPFPLLGERIQKDVSVWQGAIIQQQRKIDNGIVEWMIDLPWAFHRDQGRERRLKSFSPCLQISEIH